MKGFSLCLVALIISIFVFCCPVWPAETEDMSIKLDNSEQKITIHVQYGKNKLDTGSIMIHNEGSQNQPVDLAVTELKQGNNTARLVMLCKAVETNICLGEPSKKIPFKIIGIDFQGDYEGEMTLTWGEHKEKSKKVKVTIKKQARPKNIELVGSQNERLKLPLDDPDTKSLRFKLQNPVDGCLRENLKLNDEVEFKGGGRAIKGKIEQKTLRLDQGQWISIDLTFKDNIPKGDYEGTLTLVDEKNENIRQEFTLALSSSFMKLKDIFNPVRMKIYGLVFLGIIISIFLTVFTPISTTKRINGQNSDACDQRIKGLTEYEIKLKQKLLVELARTRTINENTTFYTPSAHDRLKIVSDSLVRINGQLDVRDKVQGTRELVENKVLPYSEDQEIWALLDNAGGDIYAGSLESAEKKRQEAEDRYNKFVQADKEALKGHFIEICSKKEGLLQEIPTGVNGLSSHPLYIQDLIKELREDKYCPLVYKMINNSLDSIIDPTHLCELDLKYNKVRIYFERFLKSKKMLGANNQQEEAQNEIVSLLKSDEHHKLRKAIEHCDSFKLGITKRMIADEIVNKNFKVVHEPVDPNVNKPVDFRVVFNNANINESPLVDDFRYIWDFDDKTKMAQGFKVTHYFKRRGSFILFRKWVRRNLIVMLNALHLSVQADRLKAWKTFKVKVDDCRDGNEENLLENLTGFPVTVSESIDKEYSSDITFTNLLSYVVTLVLSCVLAVTDTLSENYAFTSMKDYLTPILLGFTLDTFRDTLKNPANLLGKIKKP